MKSHSFVIPVISHCNNSWYPTEQITPSAFRTSFPAATLILWYENICALSRPESVSIYIYRNRNFDVFGIFTITCDEPLSSECHKRMLVGSCQQPWCRQLMLANHVSFSVTLKRFWFLVVRLAKKWFNAGHRKGHLNENPTMHYFWTS